MDDKELRKRLARIRYEDDLTFALIAIGFGILLIRPILPLESIYNIGIGMIVFGILIIIYAARKWFIKKSY